MLHYWAIYRIPEVLDEESECAKLLSRHATPRVFMGKAYVFVESLVAPSDPLIVQLTDENSLPQIAAEIEAWLDDNNNRCVVLSKSLASQLHKLLTPSQEEI